jgi:hypothetical protein
MLEQCIANPAFYVKQCIMRISATRFERHAAPRISANVFGLHDFSVT